LLERVLTNIAIAILAHYARRPRAVDADNDPRRARAADAVREWLRRNSSGA
jgi:hypothetical protein